MPKLKKTKDEPTIEPPAPKASPTKAGPTRPSVEYVTVCRACAKGTEAQRAGAQKVVAQNDMGDAALLCKQHGPKPVHRTIVKSRACRVPL